MRQHTEYWNQWIRDMAWIDIINERIEIPSSLRFLATDLNKAIGRSHRFHGIDSVGESNINGVYKATYHE